MAIKAWNIVDGEIQFTSNTFVDITDEDALAQRLEGRIRMQTGEWHLDPLLGINWIDVLGTKPFRAADFEPILRAVILADPAVVSITSLTVTPNNATRELDVQFEVSSDVGLVNGGVLKS